jgi:alpha-amylase
MRKITLFSVLFLLMGWVNAWAQTLVTSVDELTNGTVVALQCRDTNGGPNWYFNGNAVKTEALSYSNLYKVRTTEGGFALQRLLDGTYVGKDGNNQAVKATLADAAIFTASIATAGGWTTVVEGTKNGTYTIRFTTDGTYLNTKDKVTAPAYATGTGGYSVWYVYTFTAEQAANMQPYHRFESPRGGYLNANGESGNLQHIANNKEASLWKINLIDGQDGVKLSNASLPNLYLATTSSFTAEGATWYVLDNPYRTGYKCISLTSDLSANCIDASNAGPGTGTWQPSSGDNEGTSWAISTYNPLSDLQNLVNSVENACGTDPGFIAQTAEITSAVATAKALIESGSSDMEQLDASITALEGILNTASRIMPEAGKLYMIVCSFPGFEAQQGVKKVMYSNGAQLMWGSLNERDVTQYWKIVPMDGGYSIQNYEDGKYAGNFTMGETAVAATLAQLSVIGQFNININGQTAHTNNHANGDGVSGNIINYGGGANTASSWYIKEVEEPQGERFIVTYNIQDALGNTIATETHEILEGNSYPELKSAASSSAFFNGLPTGTVTASGTFNVTIVNLPFVTSTINGSFSSDNHWYTMTVRGGAKQPTYNATSGKVDNSTTIAEANVNNVFAFTGDAYNGFKIYNGAAGANKQLFVNDVNNEICVFAETGAAFGLYKNTESGYQFKLMGSASTHMNDVSNQLGVWAAAASATNGGSTFTFVETDIDLGTTKEVTYHYLVDGVEKATKTGIYNPSAPAAPEYPFVNLIAYTPVDDNNVNVTCTYAMPFTASASYETATWYAMDMHSNDSGTGDVYNGTNRYIWTFVAENEDVQLPKVASTEVDAGYIPDNRKWAFVGDPFNGFKIYNKAAGSALTLRKAEDGNNAAVMSATNDRNVFMLHHTSENIENSFAWKIEGDSYYINTQAVNKVKVLRGWTAADGGSSCRVFASLTDIPTGTFYRIKGVANERYLTTGNIGTNMPMVEDGTGAESIFYFDNERKLWNYASGLSTQNTHSTAGVGEANTWEIKEDGEGQYLMIANATPGGAERYLYNYPKNNANVGKADRTAAKAGNNSLWIIEPVTELPVSVSKAGYATLFAPKALNIPTDMEAYSGAVNTEKSALEMTAVEGIIPANTPVVLKAAAGNYTFTIATEEGTPVESNDLLGVVRRTATPADTYTLQNQNGNVGFYPYNGENINGFKAYITLPADAGVNGLSFSFGEATGIESISAAEADNSKSTEIYDLAGRRVSKPVKGLYIIGGKKVIVK